LTERQRKLQASRVLGQLVSDAAAASEENVEPGSGTVLLDNIELLFDASLALDPLRLLEEISRNWTLVVAWPGQVEGGWLLYARPGHPEYKRYPVGDLMIVAPTAD
ncbi:MAG: BREX-3 system P-loop-containing protein BrxF, partial [Anaerolineae bacterium]